MVTKIQLFIINKHASHAEDKETFLRHFSTRLYLTVSHVYRQENLFSCFLLKYKLLIAV